MSSAPQSPLSPQEIARDARWLAQALDPAQGVVRLIAMNRDSYRAASFLDDRLLQLPVDAQLVPWPQVEEAMAGDLRTDARWIFHIGHVGSSLVSRLLGELSNVLAVREPRLLRDIALAPAEVRRIYIGTVAKLMSRTFAAEEVACVKATSFASEIAAVLVPPDERALFMYAGPPNYIGSILAGENNLKELRVLAESRAGRLGRRGIRLPEPRNDADRAAAAWACETTALEEAADEMADRQIAWMDFDRALNDWTGELEQVAMHFGFAPDAAQLAAITSGPLLSRYSKAPEYEYSPDLRRDLIEEASRNHKTQVREALAMLERAAQESPLLARALSRSTEA
jgi:hypothetical protein